MKYFAFALLLSELGRKSANPNADTPSLLNLENCACDPGDSCEDLISVTLTGPQIAGNFEGVTIDGVLYIPTTTISSTDVEEIEDFIFETLVAFEFNVSIDVSYDDTDDSFIIRHIGECVLSSVVVDGDTLNANRCCTIVQNTLYSSFILGDIELGFEEATETIGTYAYIVPADPDNPADPDVITNNATAATALGEFITALATIGVTSANGATVVVDDANGGFTASYYSSAQRITFDGVLATNGGTEEAFVCLA